MPRKQDEEPVGFWNTQGNVNPMYAQLMLAEVKRAMYRVLSSGVSEYSIGSRSLKRFNLKELQDFLNFWDSAARTGGTGVVAKRAVPTDS